MKKITAAVVLINAIGSILGCHGTGKPKDQGFDFPKGLVEENETDIEAALRELREETDITLCKDDLIDCGIHPHNKEKNIHIFLFKINEFPDVKYLKCKSYFELNGKNIPEVDYFEIIPREERHKFNKVLQNKFELIDKANEA